MIRQIRAALLATQGFYEKMHAADCSGGQSGDRFLKSHPIMDAALQTIRPTVGSAEILADIAVQGPDSQILIPSQGRGDNGVAVGQAIRLQTGRRYGPQSET